MHEEKTYIIKKPEELAELVRAGRDGDSSALEVFLNDPVPVIAAAIIESFSHGPVALVGPAVRIVQGALKARLFNQLAKEVKDLREKGKIDDDFEEKKYGFQSWVELLTIIDEGTPDEDRLEALKAMFFSINKVNATDAEQILGYQLFQIAKKLTSNELLVLKAVYEHQEELVQVAGHGFGPWAMAVSKHLGHSLHGLTENADEALVGNRLLSVRTGPDRSGIYGDHGRLTDLGLRFCENVQRYRVEKTATSEPATGRNP